ncbi:MAG: glycosyltransferase family 4 protein [Coriobacteriia bacterium]|nr:glycosyltransferase family 4 protein [Coriobacteriia bacterium]
MGSELKRPVRVLHVLRPAAGGMRQHVLQLATGMVAHGFDSQIACPGDTEIVRSAFAAGIEIRPVPIVGPPSPVRDIEAIIVLSDIIRRGAFDIVHAHGSKAGLIGRIAAMLARSRNRVVTVHNDVLGGSVRPAMHRAVVRIERFLARHTSRMIAVSDALRSELIETIGLDPALAVTVHNGIDLAPFLASVDPGPVRDRYGIPRDAFVFGQAARFAPQKGHEALVTAAVPVLEKIPNAYLLLAGDGPLLERVERVASRTSVASRILFPGFESDVRGMLAALDVFASAPVSEGLGIAAIEAMAAGLPVVSVRTGGVPEVVVDGETGILAPPGDISSLTEAMVRLARDPTVRLAMGRAGRLRAIEEFSQETMLERTALVYREVLCSDS